MDHRARRSATTLFAVASAVYLLDRVTKTWAETALATGPRVLIPRVITLRFTTNSGGAFSFGTSAPWFFAAATLIVGGLIVASAFRARPAWQACALGFVLGGAFGNLTDRIVRGPRLTGEVVDFVDVHVWPVFNVADSAIVVGAVLLVWTSYRAARRAQRVAADAG